MDIVIILLVGFIAGIVTGLIGASGVMIVVPALVALGYDTPDAIGASLFINIIAALVAALAYYKNKNINLKQG
ncbi:MAG TPA: TSUP family transporter, partial [Bacteroidales bacterium]|nr:TSUP family transporter [Bacteroidales bacterium]